MEGELYPELSLIVHITYTEIFKIQNFGLLNNGENLYVNIFNTFNNLKGGRS